MGICSVYKHATPKRGFGELKPARLAGVFSPLGESGPMSDVSYMRPLWKGSISFGLVNIPVGLYSATKAARDVKFHLLRDSDLSRIRYKRVAEADEKEVSWDHIVKGYEYQKGEYVVLTDEDFQRVEIKSNQIVDIREFVDLADIEPRFFDEPYFLAP